MCEENCLSRWFELSSDQSRSAIYTYLIQFGLFSFYRSSFISFNFIGFHQIDTFDDCK